MSNLRAYMYDISDGRSAIRQAVDDYYVMGVGYLHVYQDPMMDMGKGEVCFHDVDPLDVYVDPNSRHRFFDDAENIIISKLLPDSTTIMRSCIIHTSKIIANIFIVFHFVDCIFL